MSDTRRIERLAIVNRGEAALRCIRAVKSLRAAEGSELRAIALYTRVDRDAPFVRHADIAIEIPAEEGREVAAYLDHDRVIEALRAANADAVWPGWGFVAEDPAFAERLEAEGIVFLGPRPDAMQRLGDKISSKAIAENAGVPVTPWSGGVVADTDAAAIVAEKIGFPLVVKASAGGGGRGIRVVDQPADLADAFMSAASEAKTAFGDDRLFIEQKVTGGRHIEVQIAADIQGNAISLGCRDCSVQRRHQKVLEEAPPPGLARDFLAKLEASAVRVAREVGYCGVGTVEFLVVAPTFHFLEMNPRLQVEHGITEAITGVDLVELQIRIARGESLEQLVPTERGAAIEARVCAEDPDAGFLPAPGRIARFDPALGPRVRIDTGVAQGSTVPSAFDSLIAKVIATGETREEARSRLACALLDFDLVIEGGATNKGFLLDVLDTADYRSGGVDTEWLDRFCISRGATRDFAVEALIAAAILSYQSARQAERLNFYADAGNVSPARIPRSLGQQIDLSAGAESYRLAVYAMGSWRYRVHCDGRVVEAILREEGDHTARLAVGDRTLRVLYDRTDTGLRLEVEGRAHSFSNQAAGEVRASTPAMVVAVHVAVGDEVRAGQRIGVLEAMKMEIGFDAPVSGVVKEVLARRGQQVAAGDVILVIEESSDMSDEATDAGRVELFELPDPLAPLFEAAAPSVPDLSAADGLPQRVRRGALAAAREEMRRVLLGFDANPERAERLADFFLAPLPDDLSEGFLWELAEIRRELLVFADTDELFIRSPGASVGGELGPSNDARLRMFVRRLHAAGAGVDEAFLELVRGALSHYGVHSLERSDALERAVLRLLSSQRQAGLRHHLILGVILRVAELAERGVHLVDDRALEHALGRIARMRGLVSDAVADASADAAYTIFERPRIERLAERTSKQLDEWLATAETEPRPPPEDVLLHLADAPRPIFDRVGHWLDEDDRRRQRIATAAWLRRLYSPEVPSEHRSHLDASGWLERFQFANRGVVMAATCPPDMLVSRAEELLTAAAQEPDGVHAIEIIVRVDDPDTLGELISRVAALVPAAHGARALTVTGVVANGPSCHHSFSVEEVGLVARDELLGIHPEAAERVDLARLSNFELERAATDNENIYCLHGRSREVPADERVFVLADARSRSPDDDREVALHLPAFEHAFYEATRALRVVLRTRDPKRRLHWNRIALFVAPAILLDEGTAEQLSRRLAPATRNLGLEKVVVRLQVLDRGHPEAAPTPVEFVISDITGSNMEIRTRQPHSAPLEARSDYERRIVEARRRRLVYPYEIVRMLTGMGQGPAPAGVGPAAALPVGSFEEFDLDPKDSRLAVCVADRPYGRNTCGVVFGIVTTPTQKVPDGLRRILVLSDPTLGMGSLAAAECDRIVAALDLAEQQGLPVEWIPVSSGARIAMDSGTENLDATARVVRRIVQFTQSRGTIHVIVTGVNVGAQSYWDALATMLMHNRGALIMTPRASMVLTGRAALEASGSVSAEDEPAIGGFEHIMGPNGEAQYMAHDLADAFRILYQHYEYTYVVPGERAPRRHPTADPDDRSIRDVPCESESNGNGNGNGSTSDFETVGEIFDDAKNPGRKRPFPMRAVMRAVIDDDGGHLERWRAWVGGETGIVWDTHIGGVPVCMIGIESTNVERAGYLPHDGPSNYNAGTLFPMSSKKVARAINAASGNRPVVVLANLSGFDGSPESMRKLQLEYGAEIARAVVNFDGPIVFLVVSRYHGGAYVVFSQELNPQLKAAALEGSYASVIGGGAAAAVVFPREVRARALADPEVAQLERESHTRGTAAARERFERALADALLEKQAEVAAEFDAVHSVERAREVGSLSEIVAPDAMRAFLIREVTGGLRKQESAD